jgi:Protein of unknown function (DUF2911)
MKRRTKYNAVIGLWCFLKTRDLDLPKKRICQKYGFAGKHTAFPDGAIINWFQLKGNLKMQQKRLTVGVSFVLLIAVIANAQQPPQDKSKRPSPPGTAQVELNGKKVTIDYSRPSLKGRKVGKELAPYGEVWRTGANEATTLTTEIDLNIGGVKVPAGKYTLYTLPAEGTWKLIINKQTGQWGTEYNESQDLARVDMKKSALPQPVEQFTISFDNKSGKAADLNLAWESTRVSVSVKAE